MRPNKAYKARVNEIGVAIRPVNTCFQNQYSLPTFQREYKWESKHFGELLTDIQSAFKEHYEPTHGRKDVAKYRSYFVGSIITSGEVAGKHPIIDGQQRLTSLFVLLAFLKRYCHEHSVADVRDLSGLLQRTSYGTVDYTIEFSAERKAIFSEYLDLRNSTADALQRIDNLSGLDEGDQRIVAALKAVDEMLDDEVESHLAFFVDYLIEKVVMIEIAVANENDAHRVFVTMNDRGLRLGPIDLLKGHVLSRIKDTNDNTSCHELWVKSVKALKDFGAEEDSLFFRALLRARWADTVRDKTKKKGDPPGDFEIIGDAYHRWFVDKSESLGYVTSDDYVRFGRDEVPRYCDIYSFIRRAEEALDASCPHVYYVAARKYTLQPTLLLAPILPSDSESVWRAKIKLVAQLVDLILVSRSVEGKENNYDNVKDLSFELMKQIRGKPMPELLAFVQAQWPTYVAILSKLPAMTYTKNDRTEVLYVLARMAAYLESELSLTTAVGFETYWSRDRGGKTFDVEHILCLKPSDAKALGFAGDAEHQNERNKLGALVVLPRSRNRSLQDKIFSEKLSAYATENVLAQSLSAGFYVSNPAVSAFAAKCPELTSMTDFTKSSIEQRGALYAKLAAAVWTSP